MSYSFQIRAATKAEAKAAVEVKIDEAIAAQSCHKRDREQALAAANAFIDLVADDDSKDISVGVSGSLMGNWEGSDVVVIKHAQFSVSAGQIDRVKA